jgi:hypothetical protein
MLSLELLEFGVCPLLCALISSGVIKSPSNLMCFRCEIKTGDLSILFQLKVTSVADGSMLCILTEIRFRLGKSLRTA